MLQNACLHAKIGFDTAENETSKVRVFLVGVRGVIWNPSRLRTPRVHVSANFRAVRSGELVQKALLNMQSGAIAQLQQEMESAIPAR